MTTNDIRRKFLDFYKARGHAEIPSAPLVPENDPTTLFTSSGMQPLIPYLLGQKHPSGKRLVDSQKSFRAQDIDEVGDNRHTTFFEMLGNWSLGDYFKKEQLPWIWEFLTKELSLDPKRLYVSVFAGNDQVPKDEESIGIWKEIFAKEGIIAEVVESHFAKASRDAHIFLYNARKNWWSRSGEPEKMPAGELGGPDSEVFFDFGLELGLHEKSPYKNEVCHPNCDCGRFMEIANSVFMQYKKEKDGSLQELAQKNVDFGGGLERMAAAVNGDPDIFTIDIFSGAKKILEDVALGHSLKTQIGLRIILDHLRATMFLIDAGVTPSNKGQGYVLRRLIRRAAFQARSDDVNLDINSNLSKVLTSFNTAYAGFYPTLLSNKGLIASVVSEELSKFEKALDRGIKEIEKADPKSINASFAFNSLATYGMPFEITQSLAQSKGIYIDQQEFDNERKRHQDLSRSAGTGMFKGGLADQSEQTTKLHTAHHLFLAAAQKLVDPSIKQRGSNITAERLRIDFNFSRKLTDEELRNIETLVNEMIQKNMPVVRVEMPYEIAENIGAQMEFGHKYPEVVSVYIVGLKTGIVPEKATNADYYSAEFCGGPHVSFTGALGHFTIKKEESAGAGIRRVYAALT